MPYKVNKTCNQNSNLIAQFDYYSKGKYSNKKKKKKGMPYGSIYKVYAALGQGNKNLEYHVRLTCKGALHCFISN